MATAIIDTIVSFAVGDSGVSPTVTNPEVKAVVDEFWTDPRNRLGAIQEVTLRSQLLLGEMGLQLLVGRQSGVVRFAPIDPVAVQDVEVLHGNPLWPARLVFAQDVLGEGRDSLTVAQVDDVSGLRDGEAMWWAPWRTLATDVRGMPYITSVLDWLDSYDTVLSNLIDRTALARYMVWDVTVQGDADDVDEFVRQRGGRHVPPSGSVEVHNDEVTWEAKSPQSGAYEDAKTNNSVLTNIAAGAGLSRVWLADPEDANKATSVSMAEPVRRRVGAVQRVWLEQMTDLCRFAVDRAVAAGRLRAKVEATDPRTGARTEIPAAQCVMVTGPEIAAADAGIHAQVMLNLATGLEKLVTIGALTTETASLAAKRAWEDFMGVPYRAELDKPDADPGDVATAVDDAGKRKLRAVPAAAETQVDGESAAEADGDDDRLHHYWTRGEGRPRWVNSPHPWTTLVALLTPKVGAAKAKVFASRWFIEVFGYAAGSDKHRVASGKPPRGSVVGPG